jgi:toxin HigB-1
MAIRSFRDKRTADFASGKRVRPFEGFARSAQRALIRLDQANRLFDLATPGTQLRKVEGDPEDRWYMRINDQWRLRFRWQPRQASNEDELEATADAEDVEIWDPY